MESPQEGGLPVNLGNPEEVTILELARRIADITGTELRLTHAPRPANDPSRRCPDIRRATALTGWRPAVALEDGLRRTIDYFRGRASNVTALPAALATARPTAGQTARPTE
jgi:nucleoside-diphosphate-sugar epimerase